MTLNIHSVTSMVLCIHAHKVLENIHELISVVRLGDSGDGEHKRDGGSEFNFSRIEMY